MLAVQPGGNDRGDEELGAVGAGARVGHGQQEGLRVLQLEVLVRKLHSVDGLAARAVARLHEESVQRRRNRSLIKNQPYLLNNKIPPSRD